MKKMNLVKKVVCFGVFLVFVLGVSTYAAWDGTTPESSINGSDTGTLYGARIEDDVDNASETSQTGGHRAFEVLAQKTADVDGGLFGGRLDSILSVGISDNTITKGIFIGATGRAYIDGSDTGLNQFGYLVGIQGASCLRDPDSTPGSDERWEDVYNMTSASESISQMKGGSFEVWPDSLDGATNVTLEKAMAVEGKIIFDGEEYIISTVTQEMGGTIEDAYGGKFTIELTDNDDVYESGDVQIDNAYGVYTGIDNNLASGDSVITKTYGVYSDLSDADSTTGYGFYTKLGSSVTNAYAFNSIGGDVDVQDSSENTVLYVDTSNDSVGIGTSSPSSQLHIHDGPAGIAFLQMTSSSSGSTSSDGAMFLYDMNELYINNQEDSDIYLGTNNTTRMTIENGGDVGIGTTSPDTKFHVEHTDHLYGKIETTGADKVSGVQITANSSDWYIRNKGSYSGSSNELEFYNSGQKAELDTSGNLSTQGYVDAAGGFKDNGTAGIDKTFGFEDIEGQMHVITISGGIITQWDIEK